MTQPMPLLAGLSVLAGQYEALLCDVWGVVHNGRHPDDQAVGALKHFRQAGGTVVLITNSPRPATSIALDLDAIGVPHAAWDAMVSSGDVTRALIRQYTGRPLLRVGPDRDLPLFADLGVRFAGAEAAAAIVVTDLDRGDQTPGDYADRLCTWRALGLPMICANPDIMVEEGDRLVYCGGALGEEYRKLGGEVLMAGKPFAPIYEEAVRLAAKAAGRPLDKHKLLAIGDSVRTDVKGAAAFGLDFLFIAGAIHAQDFDAKDD
ncbi:MAG: TIGR01459 family HAD-type hydrolase, partial [Cucumibacter sp.]